jgi:hypothetical protein
MNRGQRRRLGVALLVSLVGLTLGAGLVSVQAQAAAAAEGKTTTASRERVVRVHRLELADTSRLTLINSVGEIEFRLGNGPDIEVSVEIKRSRRNWFSERPDLSTVDIDITRRGGQLRLALEQDNVSGRWQVTLPKKRLGLIEINAGVGEVDIQALTAKLEIDLGVGEVDAQIPDGIVDVDVGVGDIKISTRQASAGNIQGSVGVGEVTITGEGVNSRGRGVVRVGAAGGGDQDITATAGVGDIEIVLTRP